MQAPDHITLVLRAPDGGNLEQVLPFALLGTHVSIGSGLAVIVGASEGDLQWEHERAIARAAGAPQMAAINAPWSDKQVLDFLSVALRHVVVEGDLKFSDINDALRYMADKGEPAFCKEFDIDGHVRLMADARRYRHLRDRECIEDAENDLLVLRGDTYFTGEELDREIDTALRLECLQQAAQEQQP